MCGFARAETYVSLHNIGSYTRVAIILYIHDYTCILVNICMLTRGSNCECVQGQEHMWYMKCGVLTAANFSASNSYE